MHFVGQCTEYVENIKITIHCSYEPGHVTVLRCSYTLRNFAGGDGLFSFCINLAFAFDS